MTHPVLTHSFLVRTMELNDDVSQYETIQQACFYALMVWLVLEVLFALSVYFMIVPGLQKLRAPPPFHSNIVEMMKRTFDEVKLLKSYTFEMYVSGFCNGAKFEDICLENFRSFLAWGMFHKHLKDLTLVEADDVEDVLAHIDKIHPELRNLKPGFNPAVSHCALTLEPIPWIHRPLFMYVMVGISETLANAVFLRACGFHSLELDGTHYWYKQQGCNNRNTNALSSDGTEPMVFLHGISTGWMLYLHLVTALGKNRTLLLVDVNAIKIKSLNFDMPTPKQFADRVSRILDRHNIARASFVGHSFGSVTAGWFVRYFPTRVSHLTLIDPVTILLSFPEVAYNFLYRPPTKFTEWVIHLAASREITVSHALRRHFWWYNNALWLEDVPEHIGVVVGVSANDEIIAPAAVFEYSNNCRQKRLQARRAGGKSITAHATVETRRMTRSMSRPLLEGEEETEQDTSRKGEVTAKPPIAMIETVLWENYSHGQILLPTEAQKLFVQMAHNNEKIGSVY